MEVPTSYTNRIWKLRKCLFRLQILFSAFPPSISWGGREYRWRRGAWSAGRRGRTGHCWASWDSIHFLGKGMMKSEGLVKRRKKRQIQSKSVPKQRNLAMKQTCLFSTLNNILWLDLTSWEMRRKLKASKWARREAGHELVLTLNGV